MGLKASISLVPVSRFVRCLALCQDGEGACGAGIYNLGNVNIKGNSVFSELFADTEKVRKTHRALKATSKPRTAVEVALVDGFYRD